MTLDTEATPWYGGNMHASHSSINSYLRCGKAFELEKIKNYPTMPAWWLIGGSAVHKVTEHIDKNEMWNYADIMALDCLHEEMTKALKIEPQMELWLAGGWGKNQQRYEYWKDKVVEYAWQWQDIGDVWTYVELDVSTVLPSGIEVKGFVDRVKVFHDGRLANIVDLKSGATRPDSDQQLGFYKVLTEIKLGLEVHEASNYMFKDDTFYTMDVSHWTLDTVDKMVQQWYSGVSNKVFLPVRGKNCERCSVADACFLQSGDTDVTRQFDSLNPHYSG